jgi:electron transfer flavoprotein beta subunit
LHIIVCIKSVVVDAPRGKIVRTADKCALNPFDRPALEVALQLKEKHGGSVTAFSMGPPTAEAILRETLAAGADRAVLLSDPALAASDTLATATALCAGVDYNLGLSTCCSSAHGLRTATPARSVPRPPCCWICPW